MPPVIAGDDAVVGRYVGSLDYALTGNRDAECLHSVHFEIVRRDDYWLGAARIQLFVQLTPCPTYFVCVGRVLDDVGERLETDGWKLPDQGAIGRPLEKSIPKWIGTPIFGDEEQGKKSDIYQELRSIGLCE